MKLNRLFIVGPLLLVGSVANAQLTGSQHDFYTSAPAWNTSGEMCAPCHTPHNAPVAVVGFDGLLWNHSVTSATFQMYTSLSLDGAITAQPVGSSLLCLSCHDGTVGLGDFGGATGTTAMLPAAPGFVGVDLRGEHPISITYDVADIELRATSFVMNNGQQISDVLEGGTVQCSSCHDVHNSPNEVTGSHLLRDSMAGSALCLNCHDK